MCKVVKLPGEVCKVVKLPGEVCKVAELPGEVCKVVELPGEVSMTCVAQGCVGGSGGAIRPSVSGSAVRTGLLRLTPHCRGQRWRPLHLGTHAAWQVRCWIVLWVRHLIFCA